MTGFDVFCIVSRPGRQVQVLDKRREEDMSAKVTGDPFGAKATLRTAQGDV